MRPGGEAKRAFHRYKIVQGHDDTIHELDVDSLRDAVNRPNSAQAAGSAVRWAEIPDKAASFEGSTVAPLSAAYVDGGPPPHRDCRSGLTDEYRHTHRSCIIS